MKLWRLTRAAHVALDGAGVMHFGSRYAPPGLPMVNFASDAALAVLIALRYLPPDRAEWPGDFVLGWTKVNAVPIRIGEDGGDEAIGERVVKWLKENEHLLAAISSRVLPEGDVIMLNPRHVDAPRVVPLKTRPFDFAQCLHRPPMLDRYPEMPG